MHADADLLVHLRDLEVELHQPAALLLSATQHAEVFSDNFAVRRLSTDVALLTYRAAHVQADGTLDRFTLRASIWQRVDGGWQISFHQGTATAAFEAG